MTTQTTVQTQPIGKGYSENYPCICIQDYETNKWVWFNIYEIFQNSNDLEEFGELMKKARKSVAKDEWFYSDCLYLNSIYSEHIMDYELYEYCESLENALVLGLLDPILIIQIFGMISKMILLKSKLIDLITSLEDKLFFILCSRCYFLKCQTQNKPATATN